MKTYVGIDNGVSGAIAALTPDDQFGVMAPVKTLPLGRRRVLDVAGNASILRRVAEQAGGRDQVVVVCEKQQLNPRFGVKGNFANGQNGEFWRVLLTLEGYAFMLVHARTWQSSLLKAFRGTLTGDADTKKTARLFLEQRYPQVQLDGKFNAEHREALRDAMCLALWGRSTHV